MLHKYALSILLKIISYYKLFNKINITLTTNFLLLQYLMYVETLVNAVAS